MNYETRQVPLSMHNDRTHSFTIRIYFDSKNDEITVESSDIDGLIIYMTGSHLIQILYQEGRLGNGFSLEITHDAVVKTYTATSPSLPCLVAEAKNKYELMQAVSDCVDLLLKD